MNPDSAILKPFVALLAVAVAIRLIYELLLPVLPLLGIVIVIVVIVKAVMWWRESW